MQRITCGLGAALLLALAAAAPASADNEMTDKCGAGDASLPALVDRDVTVPWLDLCGGDVRGVAGSGPLRALHVTLRLAGDTANRAGSAAYDFAFTTASCTAALTNEDLGPASSATKLTVSGNCGATSGPCEAPSLPGSTCRTGGVGFTRVLPASDAKLSGSTVTIDFDPNTLPVPGTPKAFLAAFQPGQSLAAVAAFTFARLQYGPTDDYNAQLLVDDADGGAKPVALGGAARTRSRR